MGRLRARLHGLAAPWAMTLSDRGDARVFTPSPHQADTLPMQPAAILS